MRKRAILMSAALSLGALCSTIAFGVEYDLDAGNVTISVSSGNTEYATFVGSDKTRTITVNGGGTVYFSNQTFTCASISVSGDGTKLYVDGGAITATASFKGATVAASGKVCEIHILSGTHNFKDFQACTQNAIGRIFCEGGTITTTGRAKACTANKPAEGDFIIDGATVTPSEIKPTFISNNGKGRVILRSGVLSMKSNTSIFAWAGEDWVIGDGGTIRADAANRTFIDAAMEYAVLTDNGLTIDTGTYSGSKMPKSLANYVDPDTGVESEGVLFKKGSSQLLINGDGSTHAKTVVQEGSLVFDAAVTTYPAVEVVGGTLSYKGTTGNPVLGGLTLGTAMTPGTLALDADDTVVLSGNAFNPVNVMLDLPDITTIGTTYDMVRVQGHATADSAALWAAVPMTPVEGIAYAFTVSYDEESDTSLFSLSVNRDANVKRQITVTAGEGGSVDFESGEYLVDTELTITATPNEGYSFVGWLGTLPADCSSTNPVLSFVVAGESVTLEAKFLQGQQEGVIDLSAGDVEIEIAPGGTFTATSVIGGAHTLTVSGGGTLILPEDDYSTAWSALVIDGVTYYATDETSLGSGPVLIKNGGRINFSDPFTLNNVITVESGSTGSIYFPEGVTTIAAGKLVTAGATFYKLGPGLLYSNGDLNKAATVGNSRWICEEGDIKIYGQYFGVSGFVIEMHEGTVLRRTSNVYHLGIGNVVLRGAQFLYELPHNSVNNNLLHMGTAHFAAGSFALSALASTNGAPSYVSVDNPFSTYFTFNVDVEENATLYLNSNLRGNGTENLVSLRKTGLGRLCLMKSPYEHTSIIVDAGTLALSGRNARIGKNVALVLGDDARIELENGAVLDNVGVPVNALVAEAEVHLDASVIAKEYADGSYRPSVANLGSTGGLFQRYSASGAPYFTANSFNGKPAFWCKTASSTGLGAAGVIPNTGSELSIYFVANPQLTLFTFADANHGKNASPICFTANGVNDQPTKQGGFCYKYAAANKFSIYFQGNDTYPLTIEDDAVALSKGPFIDCVRRDATSADFLRWYSDTDEYAVRLTGQAFENFNFFNCAIMAWMKGPGNIWQDNTCPMDMSEVLVFTRRLTDEEDAAIRGYLAKKWFNSTAEWPELPKTGVVKTIPVSVAEGETGVLALDTAEGERQVKIVKEGAGALVNVSSVSNNSKVVVNEGSLVFDTIDAKSVSPAAIWFDAADTTAVMVEGNAVTEVKNKGWAGGVFASSPASAPTLGAINGRQAVQFDGIDDFLRTTTFTNSTPRQLYVYIVNQRDEFKTAGGYFSFTQIESDKNDDKQDGAILAYDNTTSEHKIDAGTVDESYGTFDNSVPVIDYYYVGDYTVSFGQMNADSTYDNAVQQRNMHAKIPADDDRATINNLFQIGARKNGGDVPKWFWNGKIGEVIVFEQPLNIDQLTELVDYFRAKWLGCGGSAEPPAWLVGRSFCGGNSLEIDQKAGSAVVQNGPVVNLGAYTAENGSCWVRETSFDLSEPLFAVDGDVDIDGALTVDFAKRATVNQPLLTYSGTCSVNTLLWTGNNAGSPAKTSHDSAQKQILVPRSGFLLIIR